MPKRREIALILIGAARGAGKGALVGATLSVATGAAVAVALPGGIPAVSGLLVIKTGTVAAWSGVGSAIGAVAGGTAAHMKKRRRDREIQELLADFAAPVTA